MERGSLLYLLCFPQKWGCSFNSFRLGGLWRVPSSMVVGPADGSRPQSWASPHGAGPGEATAFTGPGAGAECQTREQQEKAAACVAMDIRRRHQMLLFLALQCQFMGGVLGTQGEGRKTPESGCCPGQVACECPRGLSRFTLPLGLP